MRHKGRKFSFIGSSDFILCVNQRAESAVTPWKKFQLMCKLTTSIGATPQQVVKRNRCKAMVGVVLGLIGKFLVNWRT
ncbi:MAG TPA: hypothetical protein DCP31_02855 [Cyanobacteria bacterium UBA8543]|nr:hypothetical protein [Cyanobacteria bacterium UBA8543]